MVKEVSFRDVLQNSPNHTSTIHTIQHQLGQSHYTQQTFQTQRATIVSLAYNLYLRSLHHTLSFVCYNNEAQSYYRH